MQSSGTTKREQQLAHLERVIELREAGLTVKEIAEITKNSIQKITRYIYSLRLLGYCGGKRLFTEVQFSQVMKMYNANKSYREICDTFEVPLTALSTYLQIYGIFNNITFERKRARKDGYIPKKRIDKIEPIDERIIDMCEVTPIINKEQVIYELDGLSILGKSKLHSDNSKKYLCRIFGDRGLIIREV